MTLFAFDDSIHPTARLENLSEKLVKEFLEDAASPDAGAEPWQAALRRLDVVRDVDSKAVVTNVGLLFFCEEPEDWVRGARIEVIHFEDREGTRVVDERTFSGPIHLQVEDVVRHVTEASQESANHAVAEGAPPAKAPNADAAIEELLVNALCHRGWGESAEPVKVYVFPDRQEVVSYPGPAAGLTLDHFAPGRRVPPVPTRNRRIIEFMKLLGFADAAYCGLQMVHRLSRETGTPMPQIDFDEDRTYFRAVLASRNEGLNLGYRRDAGQTRFGRVGKRYGFRPSFETGLPLTGQLSSPIPSYGGSAGGFAGVSSNYGTSVAPTPASADVPAGPMLKPEEVGQALSTAEFMIDDGRIQEANQLLDRMPPEVTEMETVRRAILERRVRRHDRAHNLFEKVSGVIQNDPRTLHEFAQTKINMAQEIWRERGLGNDIDDAKRVRLLEEARDMLARVVRMDAPPTRHAWAYFNLGQVLYRLRAARGEVLMAYETACRLAPREDRFRDALEKHRHFDS